MFGAGEPAPTIAATPGSGEPSLAELRDTLRALIGMMADGGISELDLAFGSVSIRLRGDGHAQAPAVGAGTAVLLPVEVPQSDGQVPAALDDGHVVTAPMIGTFYTSSSPSEPPFVRVGDLVEVGQTIGIIEAMKIMNEIAADHAGVVADILVDNAQAVEYGSPLLRLTTAMDTLG